MLVEKVSITNFRNLAHIEVPLRPGTVVVGENRVGKSNFIHALRLLLDPSLPNSERYLRREDFWDGLTDGTPGWDPMVAGQVIEVAVEFSAFDDEPEALTALADALIEGEPMIGRLTYRYFPRQNAVDGARPVYDWRIFGGEDEERSVPNDLRRYIWVAYLQALRDVQSDLGSWGRSPLRSLLQAAADAASDEELKEAADAIHEAHETITALDSVKELADSISARTETMVGAHHALEAELGVAALDPMSLIRGLRLFVDGSAHRPLGSASLGTLNLLYLALLELGLEQRLGVSEIAHVVMAIEEPEAHLHPHLQRLIFRRLLRQPTDTQTTIVTTHSPHIASVADPRGLVVLRATDHGTTAAAASSATLDEEEWADIERYLDATRGEIVFARRVFLVEGFAEQVLIPAVAKTQEIDLDVQGVTVCAIHGTHFGSYVRFLNALQVPWSVLTDGDPDSQGVLRGQRRAQRLVERLGQQGDPEDLGIFVGNTTFEFDLFDASDDNAQTCIAAMEDLTTGIARQRIEGWRNDPPDRAGFLAAVDGIGKGRLAQRLSQADLVAPAYVSAALRHAVEG